MITTWIIVAICFGVALLGAAAIAFVGRVQTRLGTKPMATEAEMDQVFTPRFLSAREMYEGTTKGAIASAFARLK